jgi:hypothetical protein
MRFHSIFTVDKAFFSVIKDALKGVKAIFSVIKDFSLLVKGFMKG